MLPKDTPAERKAKEAILQQGRKVRYDGSEGHVWYGVERCRGGKAGGAGRGEGPESVGCSGQ